MVAFGNRGSRSRFWSLFSRFKIKIKIKTSTLSTENLSWGQGSAWSRFLIPCVVDLNLDLDPVYPESTSKIEIWIQQTHRLFPSRKENRPGKLDSRPYIFLLSELRTVRNDVASTNLWRHNVSKMRFAVSGEKIRRGSSVTLPQHRNRETVRLMKTWKKKSAMEKQRVFPPVGGTGSALLVQNCFLPFLSLSSPSPLFSSLLSLSLSLSLSLPHCLSLVSSTFLHQTLPCGSNLTTSCMANVIPGRDWLDRLMVTFTLVQDKRHRHASMTCISARPNHPQKVVQKIYFWNTGVVSPLKWMFWAGASWACSWTADVIGR